jgi:DNA topoisomerase-2
LVLINGADGIGTGWSTQIPNYNPEDVVANLRRMIKGEELQPMNPWWRNWEGEMQPIGDNKFRFSGILRKVSNTEIEITELPIRTWTMDFKEKLEEIIKAEKAPSFIKDYEDYNTHMKVHFVIKMDEKFMAEEDVLKERFKLAKTISTTNLVAFDPQGRIMKYESVEAILREFYTVRLSMYQKRKVCHKAFFFFFLFT